MSSKKPEFGEFTRKDALIFVALQVVMVVLAFVAVSSSPMWN
jgi:hypothetical protein